jgi:ribonucleoside-diphosphate reductase alpha chain
MEEAYYQLLKRFLPAGRVCYGLGNPNDDNSTFSNCYVNKQPGDSLESIFDVAAKQARIFSRGGGVGIDVSKLRPANAKVKNVAKSSTGAVSFMDLYSMVTGLISQFSRRGALMLTIDCTHPDLVEFIKVKAGNDKTKIQFANISVKITDDFMKAVENDSDWEMSFVSEHETITKTEKARVIWDIIVESNWRGAEPGILFWDNILTSPSSCFEVSKPISTNPCFRGDTIVAVADGRNGVTIKELSDSNTKFPVYSARKSKTLGNRNKVWKTEIKNAVAFKTGTKKIIKLILSDGSYLHCTEDHRLALRDKNEYVQAKDSVGSFLAKFYSFSNKNTDKAYRHINSKSYNRQYKMLYEFVHGKYDGKKFNIDHLDSTSTNDDINNLKLISTSEHHEKTKRHGADNPIMKLKGSKFLSVYSTRNLIHANAKRYNWSDERLNEELSSFDALHGDYLAEHRNIDNNIYMNEDVCVVSIEDNGEYEDVYDLTVDDNHNFYIITKTDDDRFLNSSGILVHNCGEQALPAFGSCNLGSMVWSEYVNDPFTTSAKFDFVAYEKDVRLATRFMSEMNQINKDRQPLPENKTMIEQTNAIGLGFTALADALICLNLKYDTDDAIAMVGKIAKAHKEAIVKESILMAKELGSFPLLRTAPEEERRAFITHPFFDFLTEPGNDSYLMDFLTYGTHHVQFNTIAPNGSISIILQTSSGMEPIFCTEYNRKVMTGDENNSKVFTVYHPLVKKYEAVTGLSYKDNPNFVTAEQIDWAKRVEMQAICQKYISESISSTVNLPSDVTPETISNIYMSAWKHGLKGITIYRDGCRDGILKKVENIADELPVCEHVKFPDSTDAKMRVIRSEGKKWYVTYTVDPETKLPNSLFVNTNASESNITTSGVLEELRKLARERITERFVDELDDKIGHQTNVVKTARFLSLLLRHRVPILEVIKSIENANIPMSSFAYRIKGLLAEFVEGRISGDDCPECQSKMIYQNGCKMCQSCGYSKCG